MGLFDAIRGVIDFGKEKLDEATDYIKHNAPVIKDFTRAQEMNEESQAKYLRAKERMESAFKATQNALMNHGKIKLTIYDTSIRKFVVEFERLKNVDLRPIRSKDNIAAQTLSVVEMRSADFGFVDSMKGIVGAGGAGAVGGMIVYSAVGSFATASTGTALSALSGAAATNATLAWLGGGSLASGGLGVAGGIAVLGGLIAIPILLAGGLFFNSKAKEALEIAKQNRAEVLRAVSEADAAIEALNVIRERAQQLQSVLTRLDGKFAPMVEELHQTFDAVVERSFFLKVFNWMRNSIKWLLHKLGLTSIKWTHRPIRLKYERLNQAEKEKLMVTTALAQTLKNILDVDLLDSNGIVTPQSLAAIKEGNACLN